MKHIWLSGENATDHDLLPELRRAREARSKLKHAILAISLKKRIAALKTAESDSESDEMGDADEAASAADVPAGESKKPSTLKARLGGGAAFQAVVMAGLKDKKQKEEEEAAEKKELEEAARKRGESQSGGSK